MSRTTPLAAGLAAGVVAVVGLVTGGCGAVGGLGPDPVAPSVLPAAEVRTPPGPAYLVRRLDGSGWSSRVGPDEVALGPVTDADWLADGRLLVQRSPSGRPGGDPTVSGDRTQLVDPATGRVVREVAGGLLAEWGDTPGALTRRAGNRLVVYSPDLTDPRVLRVDASAVETDQLDPPDATFSLHSTAYTLDGVTWVQWGVNSEDDERTDHGVLRLDDGASTEVLRNEPVVSLVPASDGAALLVLMQDNGADEDCGGCVVEQRVVELDPATGDVAADYGMPEGYDRSWRVEALDKVDDRVVVRFAIGEAETRRDPGVTRQTWVYDGRWTEMTELGGSRVRYQDGGRLTWTQLETRRDEGEGAAFRLTWTPDGGEEEVLVDGAQDCPRNDGDLAFPEDLPACPLVSAPGSLLPPG